MACFENCTDLYGYFSSNNNKTSKTIETGITVYDVFFLIIKKKLQGIPKKWSLQLDKIWNISGRKVVHKSEKTTITLKYIPRYIKNLK